MCDYRFLIRIAKTLCVGLQTKGMFLAGDNQVPAEDRLVFFFFFPLMNNSWFRLMLFHGRCQITLSSRSIWMLWRQSFWTIQDVDGLRTWSCSPKRSCSTSTFMVRSTSHKAHKTYEHPQGPNQLILIRSNKSNGFAATVSSSRHKIKPGCCAVSSLKQRPVGTRHYFFFRF